MTIDEPEGVYPVRDKPIPERWQEASGDQINKEASAIAVESITSYAQLQARNRALRELMCELVDRWDHGWSTRIIGSIVERARTLTRAETQEKP
jgi:hypothetical protein